MSLASRINKQLAALYRTGRTHVSRTRPVRRKPRSGSSLVEPLEQRVLLSGTTYVVTSLADTVAADGVVTLREAIQAANTDLAVNEAPAGSAAETDVITFSPNLFASGPATITLLGNPPEPGEPGWLQNWSVQASLKITEDLAIIGPGYGLLSISETYCTEDAKIVVSGASTDVSLQGLKITGYGRGLQLDGGSVTLTGMQVSGNSVHPQTEYGACGVGILASNGTLTLIDSSVSGNSGSSDDSSACGGGIYASGCTIYLIRSVVSGNSVSASMACGYASGGGICAYQSTVSMVNTVVSGNSASSDNGSSNGGIYVANFSVKSALTMTNCTVAYNSADFTGGVSIGGGLAVISNSIIAMNSSATGDDISGSWMGDRNIIGGDPGFGSGLQLRSDSPAVNYGRNDLAVGLDGLPLQTDIQGYTRIVDGNVDIGAYECQAILPWREQPSTVVTSLADTMSTSDGLITLREAIIYSANTAGHVITFDPSLFASGPATIALGGRDLSILQDLTINGPGSGLLAIDAKSHSRVLSIYGIGQNVVLQGMKITGGGTVIKGGGVYISGQASVSMTDVEISGNTLGSGDGSRSQSGAHAGSGLYTKGITNLTLVNCTTSKNLVYGDPIYVGSSGTLTVSSSRFFDEVCTYSTSRFENSLIASPAFDCGTAKVVNCTIIGSVSGSAGQQTLVFNNSIVTGGTGKWTGSNNYVGDPGFVQNTLPGPDGILGTSDDILGDYRLRPDGFGAINCGQNLLAVDANGLPLTVDMDGNPRVADGTVDAGAYEYQGTLLPHETPSAAVTSLADVLSTTDGVITLREAIFYNDKGLVGNQITFDPSLFASGAASIMLNGLPLTISRDLTITGPGRNLLTIDGGLQSSVFVISDGNVALSGLTVNRGSTAQYGGGIYAGGDSLSLVDVTVSDCKAQFGGGIYGNSVTISNSTLSRNIATSGGGGVRLWDSTVTSCLITGNTAYEGGGLACYNTAVTNSTISHNSATSKGGGIYCNSSTLRLMNCLIIQNSSSGTGGGLWDYQANVKVMDSVVAGNTAATMGGGFYSEFDSYSGVPIFTNSTISGNSSPDGGGFKALTGATLNNTIVAVNFGTGTANNTSGSFTNNSSYVGDNPGFVQPPASVDDLGDLHLTLSSPCRNAGANNLALDASGNPLVTDRDGNPRFNGQVDIGAYEYAQVNLPPTGFTLSNAGIPENALSGSTVGTFYTTDPNDGNSFTYTLVSGAGSDDNGLFTISGVSLKTAAVFDFEANNSYSIRVRSADQGGLTIEKSFTITVTNVNEFPTVINLSATQIGENQPAGTVVGMLDTVDPDAGNTFRYQLFAGAGGDDYRQFTISGNKLETATSFDFEAKSSYNILVHSNDQGGLWTEKVFTINVVNINETPVGISLDQVQVEENQPAGTVVGLLSSTDPDVGNSFTYTLVAGGADNGLFTIDGNQLKTAASFDFEARNSYSIRVRTTDQGGLSCEKTFTIGVTDVNETPPNAAPTDIALLGAEVAENQPTGTIVGKLASADPDAGDTITYELVAGEGDYDNALFTIDGGSLKTAHVFDFEARSTYSIHVRATDEGGLSCERTFTVYVTDVVDDPAPAADLVAQFGTIRKSDVLVPGDKCTVRVNIRNSGELTAAGVVNVTLSAVLNYGGNDSQTVDLGTISRSINLTAGDKPAFFEFNTTVSADWLPGRYTFVASIDSTVDGDDTNNVTASDDTADCRWQFGTVGSRKNVALSLQDADGTLVTFKLSGAGLGEVVPGLNGWSLAYLGTDTGSAGTITTRKSRIAGDDGEVDLTGVTVGDSDDVNDHSSLKSLIATTTDLNGDVSACGAIGKLCIDDVEGVGRRINFAGPLASWQFSADHVGDLGITAMSAPLADVTVGEWLAGSIMVPFITNLHANLTKTTSGDFGADLVLLGGGASRRLTLGKAAIDGNLLGTTWDIRGAAGTLTFGKTAQNSVIRSAGDIKSLTLGASVGSDFGAGVGLASLLADRHAQVGDAAHAPTATIKTMTVKGLSIARGQAVPKFFQDSNISAGIGTLNLLNWDGQGGLFAPVDKLKTVKYKDTTDRQNNWTWPASSRPISAGPDAFIHVI